MFKRYLPLACLIDIVKEVKGRKKLQKLVYIAKAKGAPFEEPFKYHFFGPYSETLAAEIDEMKALCLLTERPVETAGGYTSYEYCLSPQGRSFADNLTGNSDECLGGVSPEFLERMNSKNARELELLSALHYLISVGMDVNEAVQAVKQHKSHQCYTDQECANAVAELKKEGLIG